MIDFKLLNKAALHDFVNSAEFERLSSIPITKHRALSHINNPRADDNDILMILAYSENEMIGYLGILPDLIFISAEKSYRCGTFSCIWVNSEIRGKGIALKLVEKSHELYDKIVVAEFVPSTITMYDRTGLFAKPLIYKGIRLYMRMDLHSILPPKGKHLKRIKPILRLTDAFINFFLDARFLFFKNQVKAEYTTQVDDETSKFIYKLQDKQLFRRNQEELNWIINYPWILAKQQPDRDALRYYFTSTEKSFELRCLKLRNEQNKMIAFLILTKRNRILKIPYCYMEPDAFHIVAKVIMQHIYKWKINMFTTFHPELNKYFLTHKTGNIYKKTIYRSYLVSNELNQLLQHVEFEIQDGDADLAFT